MSRNAKCSLKLITLLFLSGLTGDGDDLLLRGQRASRDRRSRREQLKKQAASFSTATERESNSLNAGHLKMTPPSPNH